MKKISYNEQKLQEVINNYIIGIETNISKSIEILENSPKDYKPVAYSGLDEFKPIEIMDSTIYALITEAQKESLLKGEIINAQFFTSQYTVYYFLQTDNRGNKFFDAKALSQALQIAPYHDTKTNTYSYKTSIAAFDIDRQLLEDWKLVAAGGICQAQSQLGRGGGEQIMFSAEDSKKLQEAGVLKFNQDKSFFNKGINHILTLEEVFNINTAIEERNNDCIEKNKLNHNREKEFDCGFEVGNYGITHNFNGIEQITENRNLIAHSCAEIDKLTGNFDKDKCFDILEELANRYLRARRVLKCSC